MLPDVPLVREDLADYFAEIQHFDRVLQQAVQALEDRGLLDNTLIVVASDNGMPFPRGKATLYDAGTRVPLAIRWPNGVQTPGRVIKHFVNLSDLAPTFLDVAGVPVPEEMTARSLSDLIVGEPACSRDASYMAMERNEYCRPDGRGYPSRAIRTDRYLYVYNFAPETWPTGSPDSLDSYRGAAYGEVSRSLSKSFLMGHRNHPGFVKYGDWAFAKRPAEELYDLMEDPDQLKNVAGLIEVAPIQSELRQRLLSHLRKTEDPRVIGANARWDSYPFYGPTE